MSASLHPHHQRLATVRESRAGHILFRLQRFEHLHGFADDFVEKLYFEADKGWRGELPFTALIAPDDTTYAYLNGRPMSPQGAAWDRALAFWKTLPSDEGAAFDQTIDIDAGSVKPSVTWGTDPGKVVAIDAVQRRAVGAAEPQLGVLEPLEHRPDRTAEPPDFDDMGGVVHLDGHSPVLEHLVERDARAGQHQSREAGGHPTGAGSAGWGSPAGAFLAGAFLAAALAGAFLAGAFLAGAAASTPRYGAISGNSPSGQSFRVSR